MLHLTCDSVKGCLHVVEEGGQVLLAVLHHQEHGLEAPAHYISFMGTMFSWLQSSRMVISWSADRDAVPSPAPFSSSSGPQSPRLGVLALYTSRMSPLRSGSHLLKLSHKSASPKLIFSGISIGLPVLKSNIAVLLCVAFAALSLPPLTNSMLDITFT